MPCLLVLLSGSFHDRLDELLSSTMVVGKGRRGEIKAGKKTFTRTPKPGFDFGLEQNDVCSERRRCASKRSSTKTRHRKRVGLSINPIFVRRRCYELSFSAFSFLHLLF